MCDCFFNIETLSSISSRKLVSSVNSDKTAARAHEFRSDGAFFALRKTDRFSKRPSNVEVSGRRCPSITRLCREKHDELLRSDAVGIRPWKKKNSVFGQKSRANSRSRINHDVPARFSRGHARGPRVSLVKCSLGAPRPRELESINFPFRIGV